MPRWWGLLLGAVLGVLIGLAAGRFWRAGSDAQPSTSLGHEPSPRQGPTTEPEPLGDALERELEALREMIGAEVEVRARLEQEVEQIRGELMRLRRGSLPDEPSSQQITTQPDADASPVQARPTFDEEALVTIGVDPDAASWLHGRFDEFELERLELLDRAMREGWAQTPSYRQERRELNLRLREELGEELYDRLLYAVGRNNRLAIRDVLMHSPAEESGMERGDIILRYDDQRVFDPFQLRSATSAGRRGESVPIELLRKGQRLRVTVPRGPLGVKLRAERNPPLAGD